MRRSAGLWIAVLLGGCRAPVPPPVPDAPPGPARSRNITFQNHGDPSIDSARVLEIAQRQYDFLKEFVGSEPGLVIVHSGRDYACGFSTPSEPHPEMFLQEFGILDPGNNYAHEMMHCFLFRYGRLPHWFNESMSDMAHVESEIRLRGVAEKAAIATWDRVDRRSFELTQLRKRYGPGYFPRVCRLMERGRERCLATFRTGVHLETQNLLLLSILSEAAGEDLLPLFTREFGFNPRTRERQRGY